MQSDFLDASERHWQDAEQLFQSQRWANADHLFGIAAECGLKKLMLVFGMPFDDNRNKPQARADSVHADGIWTRYESYRSGSHLGTAYGLELADPFQDWNAAQRYANQACFNQDRVDPHKKGAERVRQLLRDARLDGLIS